MSGGDFTIEGWDEFVKAFADMVDNWEKAKEILIKTIGAMLEQYISPKIPIDTSNLVSKFFINYSVGGAEEYAEYSTNVEYALYVNDGHVQHRRFLPIRYLSAGGRSKYIKKSNVTGIMLKERYVEGKHFIEKGMQEAQPPIEHLIDDFMDKMIKKLK